ncbi:hypothetical protein [Carboxylicivirga sp. N1Y90]|uniref:hypothetical protein n=1 Tax=Carboxylicivirga fragile TaxID=3417571 RepID=UPI003D33C3B8|nr:hypothetical protein [Marinilabiliaceae bacterium N1Y90]
MVDVNKGKEFLSGLGITIVLLFLGYISNPVLGQFSWFKLMWPSNAYFVSIIFALGIVIGLLSSSTFLRQLASFWTMLASIVVLFLGAIYLYVFPLKDGLSIYHYIDGVGIQLLMVYVFFGIGFAIIQGLSAKGGRTWFTALSYVGLLLFIFSTVGGQHDYYKMKMLTGTDRAIFNGVNYDKAIYRTPFAIKFLNIVMQDEPAKLIVVADDGSMVSDSLLGPSLGESLLFSINNWKVEVESYLPKAILTDSGYVESSKLNTIQAALINVSDASGDSLVNGWLSSGMNDHRPRLLNVDGRNSLGLNLPLTTNYIAKIRVFETVTNYTDYEIKQDEVLKLKGWSIAVAGIDERYGSQTPVVDLLLIFDRWIELKYIGFALLLIGLFFRIKRK